MNFKTDAFLRCETSSKGGGDSLAVAVIGCSGGRRVFPNSDPSLNKTSTEFAVDAAKRFPFKADAPAARRRRPAQVAT